MSNKNDEKLSKRHRIDEKKKFKRLIRKGAILLRKIMMYNWGRNKKLTDGVMLEVLRGLSGESDNTIRKTRYFLKGLKLIKSCKVENPKYDKLGENAQERREKDGIEMIEQFYGELKAYTLEQKLPESVLVREILFEMNNLGKLKNFITDG